MPRQRYMRRFNRHREILFAMMQHIADHFDAFVFEDEGDEMGHSFAVRRPADGRVLYIRLHLVDSESPPDARGNFVLRTLDSEGFRGISWRPDTWADYDDDAAWGGRLAAVRAELARLPSHLRTWIAGRPVEAEGR